MTDAQIRAMIAQLETDKAIYDRAQDRMNVQRNPQNAAVAATCRNMTATMIDMWKAALESRP